MDPTTNIVRQRELANEILDVDESIEASGNTDQDAIAAANVFAHELAEHVLALDTWRKLGGFDPYTAQDAPGILEGIAREFDELWEATANAQNLPEKDTPAGALIDLALRMSQLLLNLASKLRPEPEGASS